MTAGKTTYPLYDTFKYLLLLLLICLIAWWPIAFHVFSLKNDALNYFLPVRHIISESVSNGYWPLWTPYLNLGYPLHGDMQSGVWNPVVLLFSITGPYTLYKLQLETLLYVYLSGVGMFFLLRHFKITDTINLFISTAFMLCGFNTDSAQFLNWISAAAFLPFVFLFYYRLLTEKKKQHIIAASLFLYLLFTCAYPADFILTAYLMLGLLIWHIISQYSTTKNFSFIRSLIINHLLTAISFIWLSLPAILSYLPFLSASERGTGASYSEAMTNPYHPVYLLSYITPQAVWKLNNFSITDPLERNSYFGIITLFFLLASFATKINNPLNRFIKWGFFISLIFSFGETGGLRIISYYLLPLLDTFRHPANAKLFTIFFACLLSALTFHHYSQRGSYNKTNLKKSFILLTLIATTLLIWSFTKNQNLLNLILANKLEPGINKFKKIVDSLNFYNLLLINIVLQLPFLYWLSKKAIQTFIVRSIALAGIVNCIIFAMLSQPFTVVKKDKASNIQNIINREKTTGYPLPESDVSITANGTDGMKYFDEIGCLNLYNKKIGRVDYRITPSNLLTQSEFWKNKPLREQVLAYPVLYKADTAIKIFDSTVLKNLHTNKKIVISTNDNLTQRINQSSTNCVYNTRFISFSPNEFKAEISTTKDGFFVLAQNIYPNWKLYIDQRPATIEKANTSFMGFFVPEGNHLITFRYEAPIIKISAIASLFFLLAMLILLVFSKKKN